MQEFLSQQTTPTRTFLGWERLFSDDVVAWLRGQKSEELLLIVPTTQSGRRLRLALAEAHLGLAPRVVSRDWLTKVSKNKTDESIELLSWLETLESVDDWKAMEAAFPVNPGTEEDKGWAFGLAKSLSRLRAHLADGNLTIQEAAKRLAMDLDGDRWQALAALERRMDSLLKEWGWRGTVSAQRSESLLVSTMVKRVVVLGILDLTKVEERRLKRIMQRVPVEIGLGFPEEMTDRFDEWGRPVFEKWKDLTLSPTEGSLCGSPEQEANAMRDWVAKGSWSSDEVTLATADGKRSPEILLAFRDKGENGWVVYDPAGTSLGESELVQWLKKWREWIHKDSFESLAELLRWDLTQSFLQRDRYRLSTALAEVKNKTIVLEVNQLEFLGKSTELHPSVKNAAEFLWKGSEELRNWRKRFESEEFFTILSELLEKVEAKSGEEWDAVAEVVTRFSSPANVGRGKGARHAAAIKLIEQRGADFAFRFVEEVIFGLRHYDDDAEFVIDVVGWIEMTFVNTPQLCVGGMNEGYVPERLGGEPWLNEETRKKLGLLGREEREARDFALLTSWVESRKMIDGRVALFLTKRSMTGEVLLPSRLLQRVEKEKLPRRVKELFRPVAIGDGDTVWERDWTLDFQMTETDDALDALARRMSVTAFKDYLECPFRFYLTRVRKLRRPEGERIEWAAPEFGNIAHAVLEAFGRDEEARSLEKKEEIKDWLGGKLDDFTTTAFLGSNGLSLALELQKFSLQRRLDFFSEEQAKQRQAGWEIRFVERKFECVFDEVGIVGKIDRIDWHPDEGWALWDYKTGFKRDNSSVKSQHIKVIKANTVFAAHLQEVEEAQAVIAGKKFRWCNLQLPLYAAAWMKEGERCPQVGQIGLGKTREDVCFSFWKDFDEELMTSAIGCAEWIGQQIRSRAFSQVADKVSFDNFEDWTFGRPLRETITLD